MSRSHRSSLLSGARYSGGLALWAFLAVAMTSAFGWAQAPAGKEGTKEQAPEYSALDKKIIADASKTSEIMTNLTYLSDMIGPRLTGSANLKRASDWTAEKMRKYGLSNVHLEPWSLPEGWERGTATGKILEPENGRSLSLASFGWSPSTNGKVTGDVVILNAKTLDELKQYSGKLKGAIVLQGAPAKLPPIAEVEKQPLFGPGPGGKGKGKGDGNLEGKGEKGKGKGDFNFEEMMAFRRNRDDFLVKEGVVATLQDAGKHLGLLFTTGIAAGSERPSATNKLPTLAVAHEHYALLHRLASRPAPAKTRVELEVTNKFVPGPLAIYNTIGEIPGSEKPEEVVVVCAHLDSWDLGQGTLDNGTGTSVVLETARILANCGTSPKRTIRFMLFTGEEQGLLGSRAYCDKHKEEMSKVTAAIAHDTGTGKVIGLGWMGKRDADLEKAVTKELGVLKGLGVEDLMGRGFGGSDHASFSRVGVPGCIFRQEIAGYRFAHHSQADTLDLAQEPNLIQGAQVMAIAAMRLANAENMLPRDPDAGKGGGKRRGQDK